VSGYILNVPFYVFALLLLDNCLSVPGQTATLSCRWAVGAYCTQSHMACRLCKGFFSQVASISSSSRTRQALKFLAMLRDFCVQGMCLRRCAIAYLPARGGLFFSASCVLSLFSNHLCTHVFFASAHTVMARWTSVTPSAALSCRGWSV
jgi:hypothetical protein